MNKTLILGLFLVLSSTTAMAIDITVIRRPGCTLGSICDDLDDRVRSEVEGELPDTSFENFATGMANANSFAQAGLSSDYSDKFSYGLIKVAVGTAVQGDIDNLNNDEGSFQAEGIGAGASATFGLNLDVLPFDDFFFIELSKLDLFVSFGLFNQTTEDDSFEIDGEIKSFSIMGRYQLVEANEFFSPNLLKWGGLFLHTGIQRSSFTAELTQGFDDEVVDVGGGQTATITDTAAIFNIESTTTTIPVEISTYLRTLWALTLYGGAGFDFVLGQTDAELVASGTASGSGATSSYISDITASESETGDADPTNFRAFAGFQVNVPFVRVFTQINKGLGNDLIGVNAGIKILW